MVRTRTGTTLTVRHAFLAAILWAVGINAARGMSRREALKELQISSPFTPKELRTAYRQRSLETHPDKPGGSEQSFLRVAAAYSLLGDSNGSSQGTRFNTAENSEEAMRAAEEMFGSVMDEFAAMDDNSAEKLVDAMIGETSGIMGWFLKKAVTGVAKAVLPAVVGVLESDGVSIDIDGQQYKGSDFKQWRKERKAKVTERASHSET